MNDEAGTSRKRQTVSSGGSNVTRLRRSMTEAQLDTTADSDSENLQLRRARTQQSASIGGIPFPMLRAEDDSPASWFIPRVRSALYENILNMQTGHRNKGKGVRAWYSSYTTIDWLHDDIREQARLREMRAKGGWWVNHVWDPMQGWVLVIIVGILCGLIAGFVSEWTELLAGWKTGYCRTDWRLSKETCCRQSAIECEYWHTWKSQALPGHLIYILAGGLYTLAAAVMVVRSATRVTVASGATSSSVETRISPTLKVAYYGAGSGIPEVKSILAGFVIHGFLGVRILIVKTFGLILCCASGIMAGKEGPMVQIASSLGNISTRIFDKYYKNEAKKREIISASAAAGVSVAFGAPIGGVLFSLEEVSYFFPNKTMLRSLTCALVAALVLKAYDPFGTGKLVLFQTTYDIDYQWFEMIAFVIIGIFGGLYGAMFCKLNMAVNRLRKNTRIGRYPVLEVIAVTTLTLSVSYSNPFTRVGLGELVGSLFQECPRDLKSPSSGEEGDEGIHDLLCVAGSQFADYVPLLSLLALTLLNRASFAVITFGMKVPSGLVLPSMSIGAVFGRIVGTYMEYLARQHPEYWMFAQCPANGRCIVPGVYALVGAGATLTGATHTTIAVVAILMELTGNLQYTLPVLVGVMTARWVADYFSASGIYDLLLEHAGHPFFDTRTQYIYTKRTAGEVMQDDLENICIDYENENTIALLEKRLDRIRDRGLGDGGFAVVDSRGHLVGWIACAELEYALERCKSLDQTTVCFFNNPLWNVDYAAAYDMLALPHHRTPPEFVKHKQRSEVRKLVHSARKEEASRWGKWLWPQAAGESKPLIDGAAEGSCVPSYSSSDRTEQIEEESPEISPRMAPIEIPGFHDRANDFTPFVDQTPLTISPNSPIELVMSLMGRLGVSYLCVVDKGVYCGVIYKKVFLGYLKELEHSGYTH